jgi:uncharacterized protein YbbC (DUF1343 family)/CubicO group peptidase (beta-lactamase class C family)
MVGRRVGVHGFWLTAALITCAQVSDSGLSRAHEPSRVAASVNPAPAPTRDRTPAPPATMTMPELGLAIEPAIAARKLPGAVVAVGRAAGLLWQQAYGARAIEPEREAMTPDTIFDLASLTKPVVTATLMMQLVEAGRIDLDAPLVSYLPELAADRRISVRQLLLHTSGLPHVDRLRDYDGAQPTSALARILALPLIAVPGQTFSYSDLGYIVLGQLIERVSGEPLAVRAARQLFEPLRMVDSGFRPDATRRPRIAPTERIDPRRAPLVSAAARAYGVIRGEVHDPRAFRLGGVAGNAGAFSTAADLARYARMLLNGGTLDGARILTERSVEQMTAAQRIGDTVRTLGWDMHSRYSGLRGKQLSERAFGHGGFTGTSLWIDPGQDLFVVFLSNRVHPDGRGYVIPLIGQITDAIVTRLRAAPAVPAPSIPQPAASIALACSSAHREVHTGIDVLRASGFAALAGRNVGLVVNNASRARDGTPTLELFRKQQNLQLRAVFVPEHGLGSGSEGVIANGSWHDLPVYSLFGKTRRPTPEMLRGIDTIVFDLADVGTRFFTYMSTLRQILEATAHGSIEVVVLDRPNPIGAASIEGPVLSADLQSFVNYHALPVRHGMTTGELAELIATERHLGAKLRVLTMQGYSRELLFEQTGLPWFAPSPNLPSARSAVLYPALGLLESTNLSVGRGTDYPFEFVGAPWLDATRLAAALTQAGLPGVRFEAVDVTPRSDRYAGQLCHGVRLHLDDPRAFRAVRTGLAVAHQLLAQQPRAWDTKDLGKLVGDPGVVSALLQGAAVSELERLWQPALTRFAAVRKRYLRYPECTNATLP